MGVVYSAQDPTIGRMVAIKSIRLSDLTDEAERARLRDRLFREAQSAGVLSHPNIVTIYDVAEEDGMAYVFMELVNGWSLDRSLSGPHPPGRSALLKILRETAAALDYAHKKGIVHRDIKPANIMLHEDGSAKITDFGVAKIVSQQMTQAGILMGTPNYMSPEQVQTAKVTGRADQFALGVIAYEILTGQKPFAADNLPSLLFKIVREEPTPAHQLNPSIGEAMEMVLRRALAKAPEARFDSCTAFIDALEAAMKSSDWAPVNAGAASGDASDGSETLAETTAGGQVPGNLASLAGAAADPASDGAVKPKKWLGAVVVAAAAAVLVLGTAAYFYTHSRRAPVTELQPSQTPSAEQVIPAPPPATTVTEDKPATPTPTPPAPVAAEPKPAPPASTATFRLTTNPAGAAAIFDGDPALQCTAPCSLDLPLGRHTVSLQATCHRDVERIFTLPDEPGLIVNLDAAMGTLSLVTNPARLTVLIDGQEQTQKTPASFTLPAGPHQIQVIRGGEKQDFNVDIRDGVTTQKQILWN